MVNPILNYLLRNQFLSTLIIIGLLWLAVEISGVLVIIFISYIIMAALSPFTNILIGKRFPRLLAVIIPYVLTIAVLVLLIFPLVPFFTSQIQQFFGSLPKYIDQSAKLASINIDTSDIDSIIASDFESIGKNALNVTGKIFTGVFSIFTIFVISFYLMLGRNRIKKEVLSLIPLKYQKKGVDTITQVERKLGAWVRGQIILSFTVGLVTWVALTILDVPFALPLALMAGMLEVIPTIGPIIAAIPAIIVALTISPTVAIFVVILYIVIQMLENNILVPKIMEKAVGLNPIIIIIGVLIGGHFLGILGALLSVPFIAMCIILIKSLRSSE